MEFRAMDISGVGTASLTGYTLAQHSVAKSELNAASRDSEVERPKHHHRHGHGHRSHHGLSALRQEIRMQMSASFRFSLSTSTSAYSENAGGQLPADVAAETLGAAREITARAPLQAGDTLVDVRRIVGGAASNVLESIGDVAREDVDGAINLVNKGLDDLETDAARNIVSSASVLSAETQTRQRSTIRIRTQEGDLIQLSLRNVERMSVQDMSASDGDSTLTSTEIQISNRSRMSLRVQGDLNDAEMTAIKSVFAQAEAIADEFFGGDLAAAFDMAAGLEYDTEQLSRISMRFREKQISSVAYAAIGAQPARTTEVPDPAIAAPAAPAAAAKLTGPSLPSGPLKPIDAQGPVAATEAAAPETTPEVALPSGDALDGFFDLITQFLSSLNEGFESGSDSGSFRFFHSQSFNLQILKTVFEVSAPDESGNAAQSAATVVDALSE
jgi:hypothetical protein